MFNFNHKHNKDSDKDRLDYSYPWHDRQANQESKPSEDSSPWYAINHNPSLEELKEWDNNNDDDTDLLTPDKIHKYVENTEQSTRDYKILTDFTKWFNNYMKLRMQVDKKAKQYYISIANIPA